MKVVALGVEPCAGSPRGPASRSARQRSSGASRPCFSTARTARSKAAHTITREWVKCRGPADLPEAVVGLVPVPEELVDQVPLHRPGVVGLQPCLARLLERAHHLAQDVVTGAGRRRRCRSAPGARAGVAGEVVERALGQPPRPVDGVHDLQVLGVAGHGAQQPVAPQPVASSTYPTRAAPRASGTRRAASSSGSPSCARRRSPRGGLSWQRRRSRRSASASCRAG